LLGVATNGLTFRRDGIICSIERFVLSILGIEYLLSVRAGFEDRRHREVFGGFGHAFALRPVIMTGSHMNTCVVFMWSGARWLLPQLAGAALAQVLAPYAVKTISACYTAHHWTARIFATHELMSEKIQSLHR
jgi:hypothetical protein